MSSDSRVRSLAALEIFEDSLEWPEAGFESLLAARCAGDLQLAAQVRRLVEQDRGATLVLSTRPQVAAASQAFVPPAQIGPYRLGEILGVGGMGSVFRGERVDGLFEQSVAIKLVRSALALSPAAQARFAEERRILGRLRHPSIAQIFDGGADGSGLSWIIMEHIAGVPVTDYVLRVRPDGAAVLRLVAAICDAVQFAHQNLVVHADIKPTNVLVTDTGAIKLLDFGIARLIESAAAAAGTDGSAGDTSSRLPTPVTRAYAAPERLAGAAPTVSGDVYSLGVLLHELLTGALPAEPPDYEELGRDLAAVLRKALASDPDQRYASAAALAEDLRRIPLHLPVSVREATWRYTAGRLVRRHRTAAALLALLSITLVGGAVLSTALYLRAERARTQADLRFGELRQLANFMLFDLYDQLTQVAGSTAARRDLANQASNYLQGLSAQPDAPFDLRLETSRGMTRLASVQGVPQQPNLGDAGAARAGLEQAIRDLQQLHGDAPQRQDVRLELAQALLLRARLAIWNEQKLSDAQALIKQAAPLLQSSQQDSDAYRDVRLLDQLVQAEAADWGGEPRRVIVLAQGMLTQLSAWPQSMRDDPRYAQGIGRALTKLGDGLYYTGDIEGALVRYRDALARLEAADLRWPNRPELLTMHVSAAWSTATTLSKLGRPAEALPILEQTLDTLARLREFEPNDAELLHSYEIADNARGETLSELGRHAEALRVLETALVRRQKRAADAPSNAKVLRDYAYAHGSLGTAYQRAGRKADACRVWQAGLAQFEALRLDGKLNASDEAEHIGYLRTSLAGCPAR